jgi:hypothetical protein
MPKVTVQRGAGSEPGRVLAAVAELAEGGLGERMRLDAAARILIMARRTLGMAPRGVVGPQASIVLRIARAWDPAVTTAAEHAEGLAPAELDAFLAAAPRWAAAVSAAAGETRRAA